MTIHHSGVSTPGQGRVGTGMIRSGFIGLRLRVGKGRTSIKADRVCTEPLTAPRFVAVLPHSGASRISDRPCGLLGMSLRQRHLRLLPEAGGPPNSGAGLAADAWRAVHSFHAVEGDRCWLW